MTPLRRSRYQKIDNQFIELITSGKDPVDKHYIDVVSTSICSTIDEVYEKVITFIKWYNSQKP